MDGEHSLTARERRSALRIAGTSVFGITFFAQDVLGLIVHGGLWSVMSALRAAHAQARVIDVDSTGLRATITAATCFVLFIVFSAFNLDIRRRWPAVFVLLSMVAGSPTMDAVLGEPIIEQLMTTRGYQRCPPGDHAVGSGRARVWFNEFVVTAGAGQPAPIGRSPAHAEANVNSLTRVTRRQRRARDSGILADMNKRRELGSQRAFPNVALWIFGQTTSSGSNRQAVPSSVSI